MDTFVKPTLKIDNRGNEVSYLQILLKILGYRENEITGIFDYNTEHQVKNFQADKGLKINGIVDKDTWDKLEEEANKLSKKNVGLKIPVLNITIPIWGVILIGAIGISTIVAIVISIKRK